MVGLHLIKVIVASDDNGVITGRIGILIPIGIVVTVDLLQGYGSSVGHFKKITAGIGEEDTLVTGFLHSVEDT